MFLFFAGDKSVDISFVFGGIGQGERGGDGCWWGGFARKSLSDIFYLGHVLGNYGGRTTFFSFPPFFRGKTLTCLLLRSVGRKKRCFFSVALLS